MHRDRERAAQDVTSFFEKATLMVALGRSMSERALRSSYSTVAHKEEESQHGRCQLRANIELPHTATGATWRSLRYQVALLPRQ